MDVVFRQPSKTPSTFGNASSGPRKVLVTGAVGRIGSCFAKTFGDRYDLRLMVMDHAKEADSVADYGQVLEGKLQDLKRLRELCQGVDTVVHLAANPNTAATWDSLRESNIDGTYNLLVAAKAAQCRRVVLASSINAVSGSPCEHQQHTGEPVAPNNLYGVSKCFGEALARYMALREELSCVVVRIGNFGSREMLERCGPRTLDFWVSPRDLMQLFRLCIEDDQLQFGLFHGLSNNRFKRLDISDARNVLGYCPEDDAFEVVGEHAIDAIPETDPSCRSMKREKSGLRDQLDELDQA